MFFPLSFLYFRFSVLQVEKDRKTDDSRFTLSYHLRGFVLQVQKERQKDTKKEKKESKKITKDKKIAKEVVNELL